MAVKKSEKKETASSDISQLDATGEAADVDTSVPVTEPVDGAAENGVEGERPHLLLKDLVVMKGIIDVVSSRGGFKAGEMSAVGETYNRLNQFLRALVAKQKQQEEPEQKEADSAAASEG